MLIFDKYRLVIVQPPKCGTSTVDHLLDKQPHNPKNVSGVTRCLMQKPNGKLVPIRDKHTVDVPIELLAKIERGEWKLAVCCRNPYARAVSMFHHSLAHCGKTWTFSEFARHLTNLPNGPGPWHIIRWSMSQFVYPLRQLPFELIRCENIVPDLRALGIPLHANLQQSPTMNKPQDRKSVLDHYRTNQLALDLPTIRNVEQWARVDFDMFGYPKGLDTVEAKG